MIEMFYCLRYPVPVAVFNENRDVAFSFFTCKISGNSHLSGFGKSAFRLHKRHSIFKRGANYYEE